MPGPYPSGATVAVAVGVTVAVLRARSDES